MPKAKSGETSTKTTPVKKTRAKTARTARPARESARITQAKPRRVKSQGKAEAGETSLSEAQNHVVASKFTGKAPASPPSRPTLPASYGESHLLLLARDPQTLFAAWDLAPAAVDSLKSRIGSRAFAVSTLTLRLSRAGGGTSLIHLPKKARSRYLAIDGGPSYVAELGFTTPAGRFEAAAAAGPCFVPMGAARVSSAEIPPRAVLSYNEARALALARRNAGEGQGGRGGVAPARSTTSRGATYTRASIAASAARVIGGASDLYRR